MTTAMTNQQLIAVAPAPDAVEPISPYDLAAMLAEVKGSTFISFAAAYDMFERKPNGKSLKKVKVSATNAFTDLTKVTEQTARVNFSDPYDADTEYEPQSKGNWHTRVTFDGKPTMLSVHKGDIVTDNPSAPVSQRHAVLDANGNTQFLTDEPRLYLFLKQMRDGGDDARIDRKIRIDSRYYVSERRVDSDTVKPHLLKKDYTDADVLTITLANLLWIRVDGRCFYVVNN